MSLNDYRKLIDVHPNSYVALEVTEPGKIRLGISDGGEEVSLSLSYFDAGALFDALAAAMVTANEKSAQTAAALQLGLRDAFLNGARKGELPPYPEQGQGAPEPPC